MKTTSINYGHLISRRHGKSTKVLGLKNGKMGLASNKKNFWIQNKVCNYFLESEKSLMAILPMNQLTNLNGF